MALQESLPAGARPRRDGVRVDDGSEVRVELEQVAITQQHCQGVIDLRASSSISTLKLRVLQGDVVLQGLTLDYAEPAAMTMDVFESRQRPRRAGRDANLSY